MLSIQHSFSFENLPASTEFENVQIVVVFPKFSFRILDEKIERFVSDHITFTVSHNPNDEEYGVKIPLSKMVGNSINDIYGFFLYHFIEILNPENNINDYSIPFKVFIKDNKGNEINTETFEGILYKAKSASSDYDTRDYEKEKKEFETIYGSFNNDKSESLNSKALKQLSKSSEKLVYMINKEPFEFIKYLLNAIKLDNWVFSDLLVLELIEIITDISGYFPKSASSSETPIKGTEFIDFFAKRKISITENDISAFLTNILSSRESLYDFPLSISEVNMVSIEGNLEIESGNELEIADLDFYDLNVEYSQKNASPVILRYNWKQNELVNNKTQFSFTEENPIIANNISGQINVVLKGYDGAVLWHKAYNSSDEGLKNIQIKINAYPADDLPINSSTGKPKSTKRLRGKVLQQNNKHNLNDLTIVVQAKNENDENFKVVSAGQTDQSGNFSLDYPYGNYKEAQALISIMTNNPASIEIVNKPNQTISDDFLYLLISDEAVVSPTEDDDEDCGCHTPNKAKRLPDQADLIGSDEYTQDIGGSCINLSTPNRTLSEYNYNAIIRISDPDVANYTLKKQEVVGKTRYELQRNGEKLQRGEIDIDNPIRWEDAPDAKSDLSLYQAVTVATGHILHFKSVFKADGYSLGDLVYSLPLAPGQKKQIVVFESSHTLQGAESQSLTQEEGLTAGLVSERSITDQLSGGINEAISGQSKAHTSGMSAGLGAAGSYGGIGASLGIAGGFSNSNSSASQNGSRNVSQFFGEKLRQTLMQNASSYRNLNASVVTTVTEGQDYGVTAETIANHNHCHSLTMMYFEVMRHFAIYQEISHVEECVFVPLLLTHFSTESIHKWKDILATNLLPIPSNTYLQDFSFFGRGLSGRIFQSRNNLHPLLKGFDAIERINSEYENVEFPPKEETYADGDINFIQGEITLRVNLPRPQTRYDRIKSLPLIRKTVTTDEVDIGGTIKKEAVDVGLAVLTGGISEFFGGGPGPDISYKEKEIIVKREIFDEFMKLEPNFQSVSPAKAIRIRSFAPKTIDLPFLGTLPFTGDEFFDSDSQDKKHWEVYAKIFGKSNVYEFMDEYFAGNLISEFDEIFYNQIVPLAFEKIIDNIGITGLNLDFSSTSRYKGNERKIKVKFRGTTSHKRIDFVNKAPFNGILELGFSSVDIKKLKSFVTLIAENIEISYTTNFYDGVLFNGYIGDDILDGTKLPVPLNKDEKRSPRKEDILISNKLIEHLNSNLEHYNKVLWTNLDSDRRYMLLDGFSIQTYTSSGHKIPAMRSLASVVKNELITIAGNSLVFPVADGYKVGRDSMLEEVGDNEFVETPLLDYYKPLTPTPPYRLSVPTRGVYMEAIMGKCDACEMVKENSSQDWDKFRTEETTAIQPIITPTPTITEYKPNYKDFAQPLVNIQNAPDAPAPAAGLAGVNELLGKSDAFRDITGLAANQSNAIETFKTNTQAAQEYAKMATQLATQQHNTKNSKAIQNDINKAKKDGNISDEEAQHLTARHLGEQIGGKLLGHIADVKIEDTKYNEAEEAVNEAEDRGDIPPKEAKEQRRKIVKSKVKRATKPKSNKKRKISIQFKKWDHTPLNGNFQLKVLDLDSQEYVIDKEITNRSSTFVVLPEETSSVRVETYSQGIFLHNWLSSFLKDSPQKKKVKFYGKGEIQIPNLPDDRSIVLDCTLPAEETTFQFTIEFTEKIEFLNKVEAKLGVNLSKIGKLELKVGPPNISFGSTQRASYTGKIHTIASGMEIVQK